MNHLSKVLKARPTSRAAIMEFIKKNGECSVEEVAAGVKAEKRYLSYRLTALTQLGFLTRRQVRAKKAMGIIKRWYKFYVYKAVKK